VTAAGGLWARIPVAAPGTSKEDQAHGDKKSYNAVYGDKYSGRPKPGKVPGKHFKVQAEKTKLVEVLLKIKRKIINIILLRTLAGVQPGNNMDTYLADEYHLFGRCDK
jgi:hypothetical protein